jgi:hypothetical protein
MGFNQDKAASQAANRSSSAQTSAMRPDIMMRPTLDRLCPGSTMRTTRSGFRIEQLTAPDLAIAEEFAMDTGSLRGPVGACSISLRVIVASLVVHQRTRVCSDLKISDWANRAMFMAANPLTIT